MIEELLTANDVARILQVNVSHVYVLKQRGLKSVRLGKKAVRYKKRHWGVCRRQRSRKL